MALLSLYIFSLCVSCESYLLKFILSDTNMAKPSHVITIYMEYLLSFFNFQTVFALDIKRISCRQHIDGTCYFIHSANLCLFLQEFNPLKFELITAKEELSIIILLKQFFLYFVGILSFFSY